MAEDLWSIGQPDSTVSSICMKQIVIWNNRMEPKERIKNVAGISVLSNCIC